jgi:hypothetical protein
VAGISKMESMTIDTPTAQIHTIHWFKQSEEERLNYTIDAMYRFLNL